MRIKHMLLLLATLAGISMAGCSNNASTSSTSTSKGPTYVAEDIALNESSIICEINSTLQLTVANKNLQYNCTWASSNSEVATVDFKGLVSNLSVGTTNITATYQDLVSTCKVVVIDSHYAPYIAVDYDDITISKDQYFGINAKLYYKGEAVDDVALQWTVDNEDVAAIDGGGESINIIGKDDGSTYCVVSTTYENKYVSARVNVKVVSNQASIVITNAQIGDGAYSLTIGYDETFIPLYSVYVDGILQDNAVIQWRTDNEAVVKIENGNFVGINFGTTNVYGNFQNLCEVKIVVSVAK